MNLTEREYQALLRTDFATFVERSFYELNPHGVFQYGAYIGLIAGLLEQCRMGTILRLIISLPPRSLKSHIVSVCFVAWLLGHNPALQTLCASYGQELSDKHARDCRTLMASPFYCALFPQTRLGEKQSIGEFTTTMQGGRLSTSVGGVLTGRGADILILDDVMKPEDALSETRRNSANNWYQNTLLSRLNSKEKGVIIIVMQRLHQDDLVGHVLEYDGNWKVLSLPAIAQEDENYVYETPFGRRVLERFKGEALHPERDSLETLLKVRQEIGEYNFESQYQQSPMPIDGGVIKRHWLRFYPADLPLTSFSFILQSWDTANKTGEENDYSVCTTWGYCQGNYFLIDVFRKRLNYPDLKRAVIEQAKKHKPHKILIEDKSSGIPLIQELKSLGICGIEAYKSNPGCDKYFRLGAQSIKFESGLVHLPSDAPWLDDYVRELTGFPGTKYDDQVDSTTQAIEYLGERGGRSDIWNKIANNPRFGQGLFRGF
jgi:predicted phage terminase large subunit-like protein